MVLQQKPLETADFMVIITGPVMVRPASSDKWKAPLDKGGGAVSQKLFFGPQFGLNIRGGGGPGPTGPSPGYDADY